jgi:hypothetical protein
MARWGATTLAGLLRDAAFLLVIPAQAGLRRQDAEANIRVANGPKGARLDSRA